MEAVLELELILYGSLNSWQNGPLNYVKSTPKPILIIAAPILHGIWKVVQTRAARRIAMIRSNISGSSPS